MNGSATSPQGRASTQFYCPVIWEKLLRSDPGEHLGPPKAQKFKWFKTGECLTPLVLTPGSWKGPLEVFAVLCDKGSAAYWKSLQIPAISSAHRQPLCDPNSHSWKALSATRGLAPGGLGTRQQKCLKITLALTFFIDERQITHLICARLNYDLYDFLRGGVGPFIQEKERKQAQNTP